MNNKLIRTLLLGFALLAFSISHAQNFSNKGKEFWVGYGHHHYMEPQQTEGTPNSQDMVIYLSAEEPAVVKVTIDSSGNAFSPVWTRTYNIPANTVISTGTANPISGLPLPLTPAPIPKAGVYDARLYSLPCSFVPVGTPCGAEQIFRKKGIHIESDVPIVAYAHIYGNVSSGATMLMPVESWGYSYTSINSKQAGVTFCYSWMYVIAKHDSTVVRITPSVTTRLGKPPGVPFDVTLHKGQIYQLVGETTGSNGLELTGTTAKSIANSAGNCYPIAVFSGSSRTGNPCSLGSGGRDNDMQQLFPQQAWGKRYLTAPTSKSGSPSTFMTNMYKVVVKDPATIVKRNGIVLTGLANNFYYFESNTADFIEADKPITVAQFMSGGCLGGSLGDPEMMYISPIEQSVKKTGFYRTDFENIQVNYVTAIIPTVGMNTLKIDGTLFSAIPAGSKHSYAHPALPGYTVAIRRWTASQAQVVMESDSAFTALTYGLGSAESYGYNAGTLINNLNAVGSIFNVSDTSSNTTSHPFTCTNTPVKLSVLLGYPTPPTKLVWKLSEVGGGLSPNTDVTDNSPTPVGTQIVNGVSYFKFDLPGTYTFTSTGIFRIPILATHPSIDNCNNTEEVSYDIEVRGKPVADFSFTHTGCVLDTVHFFGESISSNGFNINQWLWTFPDATTAISQDTVKLFPTAGIVPVNIRIISSEGCVSDTTKNIDISAAPVVAFTTTPAAVCQGTSITFTDNSTYTGTTPISISYWDFGDGTIINNGNPVTHTYANAGTYTVQHTAGLGAACLGDTVPQIVTVYAQPNNTFTYPAGCLPASGVVQFTSTATAPDGQLINTHAWNFGDPASGVNNTSPLASPTHAYPTFGTYTINYSVTTVNGCTNDTTVIATFNLSPLFSYPALTAVCENIAGTISVATATVTNAVPGTGVYHGPGTNAAGQFSPSAAGPGTHTIWYVYTTDASCTDSVSQTIVVKPAPDASFAIPAAACLPVSGAVAFNYTGTALPGQTYLWNFGDPASGVSNTSPLPNPTHNYTTGTFTITLSITSNGCTTDSVITNTFNITPALAYPALAAVCENVPGTVSVATATVTNGATGTGVYSGTGVDAAGNFNPSVAGPGTHTITYTFTGSGNCVTTRTQTIVVKPAPDASFAIPAAACLPSSGLVAFNYTGTALAGQTYLWNFGDPGSGAANTSPLPNPTHNYTTGTFTITLSITSNGCTTDSVVSNTFNITPALSYPALTAICESVTGTVSVATASVTNGATGAGVYSGTGVDAAGNFSPSAAGAGTHVITYTFTGSGNCVTAITQNILVYAKPAASFTFPSVACLPTNGQVQFAYNGSLSAGQSYLWNFGDPASGANNTSPLPSPSHNYSNTGSHAVSVTVTNSNGCVDDSLVNAIFSVTPALTYPALSALCESVTGTVSVATATVTNAVSGTGVYSGTGVDAAGNFSPSAAGAGIHIITYTFTSTGNCVASLTQTITVYAKPAASFTFPSVACLPTNGFVQFAYNGSMSAGQSYLWNFGDPASGANNISPLPSPSHNYSNTGNHAVSVTVTNSNGCVDDSVINAIFSVTPALAYPALSAVCESVTGTVSVATASVTNAVSGTGVYSGSGVNAAGNFSPSAAGPGTHTITYTFTSTGNCVSTSTQTITVHPKPAAAFSINNSLCLGQQAQITDNSSIPSGSISSWNWIFGDGNTVSNNNGNPFNHLFATHGTYIVKLVTVSANGCISDTGRQTIIVNAVPLASFNMPSSVCMPNGTATFTNNSTVADGTSLSYSWNFGDGSPASTATNPGHVYPAINTYPVTLTATSTSGCFHVSTQNFSAFFDKPIANFSVNPDKFCQGTSSTFTDLSSAPNSSILNRLWSFGDGTTSSAINPPKLYTDPGKYTVELVVTSNENCISDIFRDTVTVYLQPVIDAGPSFVVPQGSVFSFRPTANDSAVVQFLWSPPDGLSNPAVLRPRITANADQTYRLTATGEGNCIATDILTVKILRPVKVPNVFSPNGDGTNDTWRLDNLIDYPGAVVEVFNRYGQLVFSSTGYPTPWDGTTKGKPLPVATYYYIIQLHNGFKPLNGSVTIIR